MAGMVSPENTDTSRTFQLSSSLKCQRGASSERTSSSPPNARHTGQQHAANKQNNTQKRPDATKKRRPRTTCCRVCCTLLIVGLVSIIVLVGLFLWFGPLKIGKGHNTTSTTEFGLSLGSGKSSLSSPSNTSRATRVSPQTLLPTSLNVTRNGSSKHHRSTTPRHTSATSKTSKTPAHGTVTSNTPNTPHNHAERDTPFNHAEFGSPPIHPELGTPRIPTGMPPENYSQS